MRILVTGGAGFIGSHYVRTLLLAACGRDWDTGVEFVEDRNAHDRRYSLSIEKIQNELGYVPAVSFSRGIADTVAWYRDNRSWWEPLKNRAVLGA